jgi:hypothetical protein
MIKTEPMGPPNYLTSVASDFYTILAIGKIFYNLCYITEKLVDIYEYHSMFLLYPIYVSLI